MVDEEKGKQKGKEDAKGKYLGLAFNPFRHLFTNGGRFKGEGKGETAEIIVKGEGKGEVTPDDWTEWEKDEGRL